MRFELDVLWSLRPLASRSVACVTISMIFIGLLLSACTSPAETPSGGSMAFEECETDPPPATSGGDHGPAWGEGADFGVDETGEPKLDVGMLTEDDPVQWESHSPSGIFYRSPTDDEMNVYGWTVDHLLVVANEDDFTDAVLASAGSAELSLPIHDNGQGRPQTSLQIASIPLSREYAHAAIPYLETLIKGSGDVSHDTLWPTVSVYLPTDAAWDDVPERLVAVASTSRGGISMHGAAEDERFWLRGPYEDGVHFELKIAPPSDRAFFLLFTLHDSFPPSLMTLTASGGNLSQLVIGERSTDRLTSTPDVAATQAPIGQCVDGLDNDHDEDADVCDYNCVVHKDFGGDLFDYRIQNEYSKDYTLIGDLTFCSKHVDPISEMELIALEANHILSNVNPPGEWTPAVRTPPFRNVLRACFPAEPGGLTPAEIADCEDLGDCPEELTNYPLGGVTTAAGLYNQAWEALEAAMEDKAAGGIRPVHIAAVVTGRLIGTNGATPGYLATEPDQNGRLVVWDESTNHNGPGGTLAHEIGHTLGLAHDGAVDAATALPGFMQDQTSWAPVLDWDANSDIDFMSQGEVWRDLVPSKFHPRASGFGSRGCEGPTDCNVYPDLSCIAGQCIHVE